MNKNIEINGNMDLGAYSPLELTEEDVNESLKEKAVSKSQQRFFGMVDAYKKGELDNPSKSVKDAADGMSMKQVKDFAKTKHKGLPNHVDESTLRKIIKNVLKEVYEVNNQENLNELSNDTIDNAYIKAMNDVNILPYGTPERVRRDAQLKNIKTLRNDKLGFDPVDMSIKMRQQGTSGNPSIDRKWATWQKNHDDRISGRRTYDDKTGRWTTHLTENDLRKIIQETVQTHLVDVLGKYTQGKTSSKEANKAIMDLANSSNMKLNENEFDELSISTMQNAYDKMLRYGQSNRASDLGAKSWKKIYHSNIDNLTIFTNVWGINVSDPSFTSENFIFNIEKCEWEGYQPRFADRKAAVILANLIRQECGERAGDFGNKAMYIK